VINLLPIIGSVVTLLLGLLGLLAPRRAASMVGIGAADALGRSEVRATYGGVFLGLGAACLLLRSPEAYAVAGAAWMAAATARLVSISIEREASGKNLAGVAVESGIGLMLLSAWI